MRHRSSRTRRPFRKGLAGIPVPARSEEPAPPTGDPPGTTPVSGNTTEVSKSVESVSMPQPGQPNDHSNLAPAPSQKAESQDVLKSPAAAAQSNNGPERKTQ